MNGKLVSIGKHFFCEESSHDVLPSRWVGKEAVNEYHLFSTLVCVGVST